MLYYFAPMEGITDSIYRKIHHKYYPGIDRYYTPFLSPTVHRGLTRKELKEIPPADQLSYLCIPQILTKNADDFIWLAQQCRDLGYTEVNLNLGCPSGTVTAKGKGSGMLREPELLEAFLDAIFKNAVIPISIKTRIGFSDPAEFAKLLDIYNRYPICELIIHPRVRRAFYNGSVNMDVFVEATKNTDIPLCYNGDIVNTKQIETLPNVSAVMIGRGLIANPGMLSQSTSADVLQSFLNELLEAYVHAFGNARNAIFRLKEHWHYLHTNFPGSEKLIKQLQKTTDADTFFKITEQIFIEYPFSPN